MASHNNDESSSIPRMEVPRPPSIISSRMTDIGTEDWGDRDQKRRSIPQSADMSSRPGTARTGTSSRPGNPYRKNYITGLAAKRGSVASTGAGSVNQPPSLSSRSHVPSLTSHAFFRPMSSQKLQAQRGGPPRTPAVRHSGSYVEEIATEAGGSTQRQSITSNPIAQIQTMSEDDIRNPPSRGTEFTEQETLERITGNASPVHGHYPTGSLTDSVRPLQRNSDYRNSDQNPHHSMSIDTTYRDQNIPSPMKSSRSFRSSFLLPGMSDQGQQSRNRSTEGAEKLSSSASSPQLRPVQTGGSTRHEQEEAQSQNDKRKPGRVHQYFDGNTIFCFGGRFQNTRHRPINIATGTFIMVPCVLFFIFEAPWLWHNISPAIPITFAYLTYICVSSFLHASVSDPGILPRNLHRFPPVGENDDPLQLGPPTTDWLLIKSAESNTAAMEVPVKHCRTCNIWRPPRAHHCRLCDNCIEGHDHHCVWLNNCVGKRNYRFFFVFVSSATLLSLYLLATSLIQLLVYRERQGITFGHAIDHFRIPFALLIFGFLTFCYPAALMGYHIFLIARGETTREYMNSHKFVKSERFKPFTQASAIRNFMTVLCRPRPPTYYQFKTRYNEGDQRLGIQKDKRPRTNSQGLELRNVNPPSSSGFQGPVSLREGSTV